MMSTQRENGKDRFEDVGRSWTWDLDKHYFRSEITDVKHIINEFICVSLPRKITTKCENESTKHVTDYQNTQNILISK